MSKMTGEWIFRNPREFDHPYEKRTYMTNSTSLGTSGWVDTVSSQIDKVVKENLESDLWRNCWLAVQIQCFGGNHSKFRTNASNGTSYSWRDSTVCQVLDCFHESLAKRTADAWQAENDNLFIGRTVASARRISGFFGGVMGILICIRLGGLTMIVRRGMSICSGFVRRQIPRGRLRRIRSLSGGRDGRTDGLMVLLVL